ncbi:SusC/RagA family TonB-linked outer membrane protein [Algoriphagus sp. NG3]|uniref:SusC/RagA family TonB-linked outer membrane protein n=1 Tax=Algoriphagus sp. NG3 TaxID=3097546 RepID=UPI002A7EE96C|nr:SusC/RagA family TonB-linked outer membrane protein [Algoriphagus sp. NG3]WPR75230.1 SusC/RagA family TonB-linked outer membrane protein [Algoriphagus sp. NG3]
MKSLATFLLTLLLCGSLLAQTGRGISGQVNASNDGKGLPGVSVLIKGTSTGTITDENGVFHLSVPNSERVLIFSFLGYESQEVEVGSESQELQIVLAPVDMSLDEVEVLSTGYQEISRERANGSYVGIDNELVDRRVSTGILERLEDITPGLVFTREGTAFETISIRGRSTIHANAQPLIVVDNFPYDGPIENINPNDVESMTVLKDAAAASIWGARAGNGVIVITTKRAKAGQSFRVSVNANTTIVEMPDLYYNPKMEISSFIELEKELFERGLYNSSINSNNKPRMSPGVETLLKVRNGEISQQEAMGMLEGLKSQDMRNELERYYYRPAVNQQYAVNLSGAGNVHHYNLSLGYDHNTSQLVGNSNTRLTLSQNNHWKLLDNKLELGSGIYWAQSKNTVTTELPQGFPYELLADENGNPLSVGRSYSERYLNSIALERPDLLDWRYVPLSEIGLLDNSNLSNDLRLNADIGYRILPDLKAEIKYQYWTNRSEARNHSPQEMFYVRDLINQFSEFDASGTITRHIPLGGILSYANGRGESHSLRSMLNYDKAFENGNRLTAIGGFEFKSLIGSEDAMRFFGYDDALGLSVAVDPTTRFRRLYNNSLASIPASQAHRGNTDRFVSYFANASYQLDTRYNLSASIRKDQSNLFGVNANQRGVPLWSVGGGYTLSEEKWYRLGAIPYLRLRLTYGYNGNLDRGIAAYTTARYFVSSTSLIPNLPSASIMNPPNPNLSWERIGITNLGLDFGSRNSRVSGTLEFYWKKGEDLIGDIEVPSSTGVYNFRGNFANTSTFGYDFNVSTLNIDRTVQWKTDFYWSHVKEKVTNYGYSTSASNYLLTGGINPFEGRPLFGVYGYAWVGLNPENGNPIGLIDGQPSEDYRMIINSATPESLVYAGPGRPVNFGSLRNTLNWRGFEVSLNVTFRLGYYYRRSSVNYNSIYQGAFDHGDFELRWMQEGDEMKTQIPSMPGAQDSFRNTFFLGSESLIEKGDHIRLQDVKLSYSFNAMKSAGQSLRNLSLYTYANNLGILWKASKDELDPDFRTAKPLKSISFGLRWNF